MRIVTSIATVSFYTALSRGSGFLRDVLIATYVGASPLADAFFVAFKLPNLFRRLFAEGAFNTAFIPIFSGVYEARGFRSANLIAEQVFSILFLTLLLFITVFEVTLPWMMFLIAPGFHEFPEKFQTTIELCRITFPYLLFISLTAFFGGILNSLGRFAVAAAAPLFLNLTMIVFIFFLLPFFKNAGYALAWSVFAAGLVQLGWLYLNITKRGVKMRLLKPRLTPTIRKILKLMGPGVISAGFMQINIFIDGVLASFLQTGAVSFLFYADRLNQLPLSLIGISISTVLLPVLSKQLKAQEIKEALNTQNRCLEYGLFFALPSAFALFILADPFIHILFERGKFGFYEAQQTSLTVQAFVCGLPAYVLVKIFSTSFFAQRDAKTPLQAALISIGFNFFLNLVLMIPFQHVGLAAATALSAWLNAVLLARSLLKKKRIEIDSRFKKFLPRLILCCFSMGLFIYSLKLGLDPWAREGGTFEKISTLVLLISGGLSLFLASVFSSKPMRGLLLNPNK